MKTVLVVEDEKMIRQGIAAMIKRSGVPVDTVLECKNGLEAMGILKEKKVDVMFTDIRMPKMNGIELVQAMQEVDNPPLTVAISGYDDFSYAVEMLRQGVREYILKPVEREKLKEILQKLEQEINHRAENERNSEAIDKQLLRYILSDKDFSDSNMRVLSKKLIDAVGSNYYVAVAAECSQIHITDGISLSNVEDQDVFVVAKDSMEKFESGKYVGVSDSYSEASDLKKAYRQARERRGQAFLQNITTVDGSNHKSNIRPELLEKKKKLTEQNNISAKVQIMGTERLSDLIKEWESFFVAASRGQIIPEDFLSAMDYFFNEYKKVYKIDVQTELKNPMSSENLEEYKSLFMKFIVDSNSIIRQNSQGDATAAKMKTALEYINKNYHSDLNMAVVSNYISMNYSLFSAEFKNYTGTNFVNYVRDLRMKEAKELLFETDLKVNEISAKVGYDNEKHFMKSFKAYVGVSPSEYRKNIR